jgi:Na+/proline symporter
MNLVLVSMLAYVLVQFVIGAIASRRMTTEQDYILAGRKLGPSLVTFSVFASFFGAEAVVAAAGSVYEKGLAGAWVDPFGYALALAVVGLFLALPLWRKGLTTFADLFRERYSPTIEKLVVLMLLPGSIFWASAQIRAFGQVLSANSALSLHVAIILAALLVAGYSVVGGLLADAVTDLIQGLALIIGLLALLTAVLWSVGGLEAAVSRIPVERLTMVHDGEGPLQRAEAMVIAVCGTIVSVELISRFLGARTGAVAVGGTIAGAGIYIAVGVVPVLLGLIGASILPGVADSEQIVPRLAEVFMPASLRVLFVGAIISAILSTVHSALHAPASQVSHNIVVRLIPHIGPRGKLWAVRFTVMGLSTVATALALTSERIHDLVETASAFGSAGVFVVTVFALFTSFGRAASAFAGLVSGMGVWLVARFGLAMDTPYLVAVAAALTSYVAVGLVEHRHG